MAAMETAWECRGRQTTDLQLTLLLRWGEGTGRDGHGQGMSAASQQTNTNATIKRTHRLAASSAIEEAVPAVDVPQ